MVAGPEAVAAAGAADGTATGAEVPALGTSQNPLSILRRQQEDACDVITRQLQSMRVASSKAFDEMQQAVELDQCRAAAAAAAERKQSRADNAELAGTLEQITRERAELKQQERDHGTAP